MLHLVLQGYRAIGELLYGVISSDREVHMGRLVVHSEL
jgi:hypothetical protein